VSRMNCDAAVMDWGLVRSRGTTVTVLDGCVIVDSMSSRAVSPRLLSREPRMVIVLGSFASRRAISFPMPLLAPVTNEIRFGVLVVGVWIPIVV